MHQIMLSVHCASMLSHAVQLKKYLDEQGYSVFLCSEMEAGVTYRTQICECATRCDVFVAFINHGWSLCKSNECEFEFNIALSSSLKSPTRTPYIIPLLLEEFSFYENFPVINGFLKNAMGIPTKQEELGSVIWAKVLKTISTHRKLIPSNPPSPAPRHSSPPHSSPPHSPAPSPTPPVSPLSSASPYSPQRLPSRLPSRSPQTNSPTYSPARVRNAPPLVVQPPPELGALVNTALQLVKDISATQIVGAPDLQMQLQGVVKNTLDGLKLTAQVESGLRALMDYLSKIKEISAASQYSQNKQFPDSRKTEETLAKLVKILQVPNDTVLYVGEFISEAETRLFWESHFGKTAYTTAWPQFANALKSDPVYRFFNGDVAQFEIVLQDLRLCLDHYNTGHVVCHRLSDFVASQPLRVALLKYTQKIPAKPLLGMSFPLLIWIDDYPENNQFMIEYAREFGVSVIPLHSTAEAKQWIISHASILEIQELNKVRIITDNVRTGANTVLDLNAGEDIIRFVRGRRSEVPVLVYCQDVTYAGYVTKYKQCTATNQAPTCQEFIEEMIKN